MDIKGIDGGSMTRPPVVLVHGIHNTVATFNRMKHNLEREGFSVSCLNLIPNNGKATLPELASQLDLFLEENFSSAERIDLVGFSMGGLVSRYYIQRLGGFHRVRKFITIGTPHRGTWTAFLRRHPGIRNMRPGSSFLNDLNQDAETLETVSFTSLWTPFDLMILPATSSILHVGRTVRVGTLVHPLLVLDRKVLKIVRDILSEEDQERSLTTTNVLRL
jgi:triacylglycerol lipase